MTIENPRGMATDNDGNIYITDSYSHKLHKFSKDGVHQKSTKGRGKKFGELHSPKGIVIIDIKTAERNDYYVFVCDLFNQRVQCFDCDLNFLYTIYIIKKSNLCPFNITYGGRRNPKTLYITGTNRIYVCKLSGDLRKPDKAEVQCSVLQYKDGETYYKFQRIGGISVIEKEGHGVQLVVYETFQSSVLVLNLNIDETDDKRHNTPTLLKRYPDSSTNEPTQKAKFELPIIVETEKRMGNLKPHPITVHAENTLFISTEDECGIKKYTLT